MKVGDRVTKNKVLGTKNPTGVIKKVRNDEIVVIWEGINGEWHYVGDNSKSLKLLEDEK